jgi:hypothetical protein
MLNYVVPDIGSGTVTLIGFYCYRRVTDYCKLVEF